MAKNSLEKSPGNGRADTVDFLRYTDRVKRCIDAAIDPTSLGNLLVKEGILSDVEFGKYLDEFKNIDADVLLGQFLVREGFLAEEVLQVILIKQRALRNGGVEDEHLEEALEIARRSSGLVDSCAEELCLVTSEALANYSKAER